VTCLPRRVANSSALWLNIGSMKPIIGEEPPVPIEPGRSWAVPSLREGSAYREVLYYLIWWRNLKVRYKQALPGAGREATHLHCAAP